MRLAHIKMDIIFLAHIYENELNSLVHGGCKIF